MISSSLRELSVQLLAGTIDRDTAVAALAQLAATAANMERVCSEAAKLGRMAERAEENGVTLPTRLSRARQIRDMVATEFSVSVYDLRSRRRPRHIAWPRHVAMYLIRECSGEAYEVIGDMFNRDHGSVLHALRAVATAMEHDRTARDQVVKLRQNLLALGIIPNL